MKRALLITGGTVCGLGAVLTITPPQFTSTQDVSGLSGSLGAAVGSTQTTASSGGGLIVDSVFPNSPSNGQMHLNTVSNRIYYYYGSQWYAIANHDDMQLNLVEHSHGDGGFIQDIYSYNGNGVSLPLVLDLESFSI